MLASFSRCWWATSSENCPSSASMPDNAEREKLYSVLIGKVRSSGWRSGRTDGVSVGEDSLFCLAFSLYQFFGARLYFLPNLASLASMEPAQESCTILALFYLEVQHPYSLDTDSPWHAAFMVFVISPNLLRGDAQTPYQASSITVPTTSIQEGSH